MTVIDFMRETAAYMASDRPDLYTPQSALSEILRVMDDLRTGNKNFNVCMFASYVFIRMVDEGVEDFLFSRKISGLLLDHEDEKIGTYGYTPDVGLPYVGDMEIENLEIEGEVDSDEYRPGDHLDDGLDDDLDDDIDL